MGYFLYPCPILTSFKWDHPIVYWSLPLVDQDTATSFQQSTSKSSFTWDLRFQMENVILGFVQLSCQLFIYFFSFLVLSCVQLLATPWTAAQQTSLSMDFFRQNYWCRLPFLLQQIFQTQGSSLHLLCLLHWQLDSWQIRRQRICLQCRRPEFYPWVWNIPQRREWKPTPVFLPGESHGQRSLVYYSPWSSKESERPEQLTLSLVYHCDTWEAQLSILPL